MTEQNVSEPECGCVRCLDTKPDDGYPVPHSRRHMVVCPTCGNKRCPKAEYHGYLCSGSNDTGQTPILAAPSPPVSGGREQITSDGVPHRIIDWLASVATEIQDDIRQGIQRACRLHQNGRHEVLVNQWAGSDLSECWSHGTHWIERIIERRLPEIYDWRHPTPTAVDAQAIAFIREHWPTCVALEVPTNENVSAALIAMVKIGYERIDQLEPRLATLEAELADRDTVPRSRYDACNRDWLEEKAKREEIASNAARAIAALEAQRDEALEHCKVRNVVAMRDKIAQLEAENAKLRLACAAYRDLIQKEYGWESWRGDTSPRGSASERNAQTLWKWLQEHGVENAGEEIEAQLTAAAEREQRVRALVAKWRAVPWDGFRAVGLRDAADELEAIGGGE